MSEVTRYINCLFGERQSLEHAIRKGKVEAFRHRVTPRHGDSKRDKHFHAALAKANLNSNGMLQDTLREMRIAHQLLLDDAGERFWIGDPTSPPVTSEVWIEHGRLLCELRHEALSERAGQDAEPEKTVRTSANARMIDMMLKNPECRGWPSPMWSRKLKVARSTITNMETWKELKLYRDQAKAERASDRRQGRASPSKST